MSIIHDALKKAEEFKSGKKTEDDATTTPTFKVPTSEVKKNQASPKAIIFVAVAFMSVLAFVFFGRESVGELMQKLTGRGGSQITKMEVPTPPTDPAVIAEQQALEQKKLEDKKQGEAQKKADEFASMYEKGNFEEALVDIEALIHTMPTEPVAYNNYGIVLKRLGRKKEAMEAYGKALALNPDYAEALNNMAAILLAEHDYAKAKELLLKAVNLSPNYLDASLHLAIAYEKNDELEKAKQHYQGFLQKSEGKVDKKIRLQIEGRLAGLMEH